MMIVDLVDTTTRKIEDALTAMRHRLGGPAIGKVLTLVIVTDEAGQYDALRAAVDASRDHPSRILAVIPRDRAEESRLDAEVHVGDTGPGETVLLRLYGFLAQHAEAAVLPLLVPDTPVVTWWPGAAPRLPAAESLGALAQRRITDAAGDADPIGALERLAEGYRPGDTDLSWTRVTPWRSLLAAALDEPHEDITAATIEAAPDNPSAVLLGAWLAGRLGVRCEVSPSRGPGITAVRLATASDPIAVTRPDGRMATLSRPGRPDRRMVLHRRPGAELIAEELRQLKPDEIYREVVRGWPRTVAVRATTGVSG
jgi:glucose-6-phosphate dehydrogenase assembly protein OpcA